MKTAWIIVGQGFQDEEFVYPFYRFEELGFDVVCASISGEAVTGKFGVPARPKFSTAGLLEKPLPDLLYLPGGFESPDRVRLDPSSLEIVKRANDASVPIAAICHGPWILISAEVVSGRKMTGYDSIKVDLRNAGADVSTEPVVVDRNFVTGDHYRNNGLFMRAVVDLVEN